MLHHIPIFLRHERLESRRELDIIQTHWGTSLYRLAASAARRLT
jgi:hypothetical protein